MPFIEKTTGFHFFSFLLLIGQMLLLTFDISSLKLNRFLFLLPSANYIPMEYMYRLLITTRLESICLSFSRSLTKVILSRIKKLLRHFSPGSLQLKVENLVHRGPRSKLIKTHKYQNKNRLYFSLPNDSAGWNKCAGWQKLKNW